ncbi:MAG: hypothetical protein ACR2GH_07255 [Pseudonocardia sp.]
MTDIKDLRNRVASIVSGPGPTQSVPRSEVTQSRFSPHNIQHMSRATALASRFMEIADAKGGEEGLADAVQEIEETLETEDLSGLAQHAVKLFLAHHKEASEKLDRG